jgi:hypothetical protein
MTELILNLLWAAIAIIAVVLAPRRDRHTLVALTCIIALLFPIISVSDDLHADATLFETLAAILAAVCVFFALVAMARVYVEPRIKPAFALIVHADPRSPPRR